MAIILQNGIKHSFFDRLGGVGGKSRHAGRLFMQNKANLQKAQMSVTSFPITNYGDFAALRLGENKANSNPNAGLWPETQSTPEGILRTKPEILDKTSGSQLTECDLKKQSQFPRG